MAVRMDTDPQGTLILTRSEIGRLLGIEACIEAVDLAFRLHGTDAATGPAVLELPGIGGGFHVKAGGLALERPYTATKINANFPGNPARGLPTIQGIVLLSDAESGEPLAVMDSAEITALRTAAATALAVRHLARADASVATIVGCGRQSRDQLRFLCHVRPLRAAFALDRDRAMAEAFAADMSAELGIAVEATDDITAACRAAQICVTCTPSATPILSRDDVTAGALVVGVGADSPHKRELAGDLFAGTTVVVDLLAQCLAMGDLRHAVAEGRLSAKQVHAELGDVLTERRPGRRRDDEIIVFDSTGMALQDVAAAAAVYRLASATGQGRNFAFRG